MSRRKERIKIEYRMDDTICTDRLKGRRANVKIHKDGRGYVKVPGEMRIYAAVERIVIKGSRRR